MVTKRQYRWEQIIRNSDDGFLALAALIECKQKELDAWIKERTDITNKVGKPTEREG